ncbi:MAG: carbamoyltransferase [Bradyrhizobium sp.]|nr:carbamoyltransferase [Bradyrhizobium sp.]
MTNPVYVLGISAFYHDAAAALVRDGIIVAAAQEERFSRKKHDPRFPVNAINYCLEEAAIEPAELAAVVFYDNPLLTLDRILKTLMAAGEKGLPSWVEAAPGWLSVKLFVEKMVHNELKTNVKVLFVEHHLSHAASAFFPSPFEEAAVLTLDGVGEWATTTLARASRDDLQILEEIHFPHSLGLLYSAVTQFCGFKVNSGEYKLMGLAPYGKPVYADSIRSALIDLKDDGSYRLNMQYFGYLDSSSMTNAEFDKLFGGPPRKPESRITQREMDLAASIQAVTEDAVLKIARHLRDLTGLPNLCMAGGVALNCVANGKLLREKTFDRIWIQPAAGDAGGALGAALLGAHRYCGVPRAPVSPQRDRQKGSYLGPAYHNDEIRAFLDYYGYPYTVVDDAERAREVAEALAEEKIVGYFVGRAEFGPRSLGARSILGDARSPTTQSIMNLKIKFRESFRPFAPSVLEERCASYFDLAAESPYMLLVAPVREHLRTAPADISGEDLIPIVNQVRSSIPAVTHIDYSARVQTVGKLEKPDYYEVLRQFEALTGTPVIVNTSFNVRGEPIVHSPQDAYRCFMRTDIDLLVLENCLLRKQQQPLFHEQGDWRQEYELD